MTKQEQLTKLIEIAVENGWKLKDNDGKIIDLEKFEILVDLDSPVGFVHFDSKDCLISRYLERIYFNHDFAKAIWGEWKNDEQAWDENCYAPMGIVRWQYHLQQAVISDDPLEYYWNNK